MKRFILIALIPLLAVIAVIADGKNTHAQSFGDNAVIQTDTLEIGGQDITATWAGYIINAPDDKCSYIQRRTFTDKNAWTVAVRHDYNYTSQIRVTWSTVYDSDQTLHNVYTDNTWQGNWGYVSVGLSGYAEHGATFTFDGQNVVATCDDQSNGQIAEYYPNQPQVGIGGNVWSLFYTTYPTTYPDNFEGETFEYTKDKTVMRPHIYGEVNDKTIHLRNVKDENFGEFPHQVKWLISNGSTDTNATDPMIIYEGFSPDAEFWTQEVTRYGTWSVTAKYYDMNGNPLTVSDIYDFRETTIHLNVDGGIHSINTLDMECDSSTDFCSVPPEPEWVAETCDLLNLGGCWRNMMHHIAEWLGIGDKDKPLESLITKNSTDTHGLTAVITAPVSLFVQLQSAQSNFTCVPVTIPLPFVNDTLPLPCLTNFYTTHVNGFFQIYQTIVNGLVAYYVMIQALAMIKGFKDPQNDRIHVGDL